MDIRKIYEYALQREHEGKRFFLDNSNRLSSAAAVGAFKRLAGEEQKHIEFIEKQIELLGEGKFSSIEMGNTMEKAGFFDLRAASEQIDQTVIEAMVPDLPVLRMAYLIEHDFAEFYDVTANKAEGDAKNVLKMLARWEHIHEKLFKEFHDNAFEQYANMPWGG